MPEKIWQSADVDVQDLLEQLTSAEQSRQVVVYDGPTCKCPSENSTSRPSCTLLAMNCVRTVFEVEKGLGAKISWAWQRSRDDADADVEFLEDLLAERTVQVSGALLLWACHLEIFFGHLENCIHHSLPQTRHRHECWRAL